MTLPVIIPEPPTPTPEQVALRTQAETAVLSYLQRIDEDVYSPGKVIVTWEGEAFLSGKLGESTEAQSISAVDGNQPGFTRSLYSDPTNHQMVKASSAYDPEVSALYSVDPDQNVYAYWDPTKQMTPLFALYNELGLHFGEPPPTIE